MGSVVTKQKLNGQPNVIAHTGADISFRKQAPALGLLDFDAKGMPAEVAGEMQWRGGFWPSLLSIAPQSGVAHIILWVMEGVQSGFQQPLKHFSKRR